MVDEEKRIKHELYEIRLEIQYLKKRQAMLNNELQEYHGEKNLVRKRGGNSSNKRK